MDWMPHDNIIRTYLYTAAFHDGEVFELICLTN